MFNRTPSVEKTWTDAVVTKLLTRMENCDPTAPEYAEMADQYEKICQARAINAPKPVDPNALLAVAGNLAGVLVIVTYESRNVLTSKALSLFGRNAV